MGWNTPNGNMSRSSTSHELGFPRLFQYLSGSRQSLFRIDGVADWILRDSLVRCEKLYGKHRIERSWNGYDKRFSCRIGIYVTCHHEVTFPTHIYTINGPGTTSLCEIILTYWDYGRSVIGLVG